MEIGISTFVETTPDVKTGALKSHAERLAEVVEEMELADQVGLDVYGIGEHHRQDYAASSPAVLLAAGAARTKRIRLTSAVTVLSSDDPVRVYQDFATLDGISGGRAEIMAGRGSFIESFPLFGYNLADYDELFEEKLELLLQIRRQNQLEWQAPPRHFRAGDIPAGGAESASRLDRKRRQSGIGHPCRYAGIALGAGHYRRKPLPFCPAGEAV